MIKLRRAYADTALGQIHYQHGGKGPPLLLLHPGPRSSRFYWKLAPILAEHFSVLVPDTLGYGASDAPPTGISIEGLADNMGDFLSAVGVSRAHVFGLHTGNKTATAFAVRQPERIDGLILCGMTHSLVLDHETRNNEITKLVGHFRTPPPPDELQRMVDWAANFKSISSEYWNLDILKNAALGTDRFTQIEQRVIDVMLCLHTMADVRRAILDYNLAEGLRAITIPTLIIELADSKEAHLGRQGPKLLELLRKGELQTIEGADRDFLEFEAPKMAAIIRQHLGGR